MGGRLKMKDMDDLLMHAAGVMSMINLGCRRVSAFNDLLEDEWEGRQSALEFLYKSGDMAAVMLAGSMDCGNSLNGCFPREILSLGPVVEGAVGAARSERQILLDNGTSSFVNCNVHLLQKCLGEMLRMVSFAENAIVRTCDCDISADEMSLVHSELRAGRYCIVCVGAADRQFELKDYRQCADYCLASGEVDGNMLKWAGMAAMHEGDLCISSDGLNGGVMLLLPVSGSAPAVDAGARTVNGRKETILLVDDEDMIWDVVQGMLSDMGYNVLLAGDGREAVDIYRENAGEIDLILMDMMMPVMNAHEAFPLLKKIDAGVRVLLMSGYVEATDVQDLLASGAMGFVRKPYTLAELAQRIRSILDREC